MKKIEKRAVFCLLLAGVLLAGLGLFTVKFFAQGSQWASFPSNRHLYVDGKLQKGRILDRNGVVLVQTVDGQRTYNESKSIRRATLHAVGDGEGRIGTGAQSRFAGKLSGYNPITGAYGGGGRDLSLTLDADVCAAAYKALDGRKGTVGVYNYKTGEILCMVSTPTFDPQNPPEIADDDPNYEGVFVNRLLGATFIPGSIFKTVTTAAAIDKIPDLQSRTFHCDGVVEVGGATITCPQAHGDLTIGQALTVSCNCIYGQLTAELGAKTMNEYVEKLGLAGSISVNGIQTSKGSFALDDADKGGLAWGGIGQGKDLVNPCAMMVYMGAVANGGEAALPQEILKVQTAGGLQTSRYHKKNGARMLSAATANTLADMMRDNVVDNYGEGDLAGYEMCAKSGTAELGGDETPHAWFTGFLRSEEQPLAFIVLVENGGSGSKVAGGVAKKVLSAAVNG